MATVPNRAESEGSYLGAVAIVASAGGIPALMDLLGGLKETFPLPIFVTQHLPRIHSELDVVLSRNCRLPVQWVRRGEYNRLSGVHLAYPGTGIRLTPGGIEIDVLSLSPTSWLASGDRMIESMFSLFWFSNYSDRAQWHAAGGGRRNTGGPWWRWDYHGTEPAFGQQLRNAECRHRYG